MADKFIDLQAAFYNAFTQALGYRQGDPFQLIQPAVPIVGGDDADTLLWNYFNNIPPLSLTQNTILSGGNQFLTNYQGVMSVLKAQNSTFRSTIGPACWDAYMTALKRGKVTADAMAFRNWALFNAPCSEVSTSGASALQASLLDPIFAAQMNVTPYKPAGAKSVTFVPGYDKMISLLNQSPSRKFDIDLSKASSDVSKTWAKTSHGAFFGLFGGSSTTSTQSQKFASSGVRLYGCFGNLLQFMATPGDWYSSQALGMAYSTKEGAPWDPDKTKPNWNTTFGDDNGNMQRMTVNIVVVKDMDVTVVSQATYSESEQTDIQNQKNNGIWPFYSSGGSSHTNTSVSFNTQGHMMIHFTSKPDATITIGCNVISIGKYLGHTAEAVKMVMG